MTLGILWRRRNGHPIVLTLLHGQAPSLVLEGLGPERLETVQADYDKLALFYRQAVPRLSVLLQKGEILRKKEKAKHSGLKRDAAAAEISTLIFTLTGRARTRFRYVAIPQT